MVEPLALLLLSLVLGLTSFAFEGVPAWALRGLALALLALGVAWLRGVVRRLGSAADAWRRR